MFLCLSFTGLFETLPGHVQCEMLLKATEQCFNTLEKAEMLLLLLKRFPESVVQHGVSYKNVPPVCRHLIEEEASHKRGFVFVFLPGESWRNTVGGRDVRECGVSSQLL